MFLTLQSRDRDKSEEMEGRNHRHNTVCSLPQVGGSLERYLSTLHHPFLIRHSTSLMLE